MERDAIFNEVIGGDKRGYKRTFGIGVNSCVGVPKQISNGALKLIQEEKGKRQALEDAMAVEVQKRMDLENEIEHETNKRKEIEEQMADEKKRRIALEDDVHILKGLLFELQPSLKKKVRLVDLLVRCFSHCLFDKFVHLVDLFNFFCLSYICRLDYSAIIEENQYVQIEASKWNGRGCDFVLVFFFF
ncbi:hypothetical protein Dimus_039586 [Dionaea muscipula]